MKTYQVKERIRDGAGRFIDIVYLITNNSMPSHNTLGMEIILHGNRVGFLLMENVQNTHMKGYRLDGYNPLLESKISFSYYPKSGAYGVLETKIMSPHIAIQDEPDSQPFKVEDVRLVIIEGFDKRIVGNPAEVHLEQGGDLSGPEVIAAKSSRSNLTQFLEGNEFRQEITSQYQMALTKTKF